jgi:hypothetical protein
MARRTRTFLLIGAVIFLAIAGVATFLVLNRFFQRGESTEVRSRASVGSSGTASITLETKSLTRYVKDEFPVDIVLDTGNTAVSAVALGLSYTSSGTTPELEVEDADGIRSGIQIISRISQNMPGCTEQINQVARETAGERRVFIDFGATCTSTDGYNSNGKKVIATIVFKANSAIVKTLEHDPTKAIVTRKNDGLDTLNAIPHITITIAADTQAPIVQLTGDSLVGRRQGTLLDLNKQTLLPEENNSDVTYSTNSANVRFDWNGTEQPPRADDTALLDQYVEFQYRFNDQAWPATWVKEKTFTRAFGHNITTGHTIYVRGRDRNNNISAPVSKNFLVDLTPRIFGIDPTHAAGGAQIVINGFNFGATKGSVLFGAAVVTGADIISWADQRIVVKVPGTAGTSVAVQPPAPRPVSNSFSFNLDTTLRLVMNLQGLGQDRGAKKVDIVISRGTYEQRFSGVDATWSAADAAYVVVTPPLTDAGLTTGTNFVVSVKATSRLRKRFTAVPVTRGTQNALVKKVVSDALKVGDVNNDNKISILDFSDMVRPGNFTGLSTAVTAANAKYDLNGDGALTAADIALLLANYTQLETLGDAEK